LALDVTGTIESSATVPLGGSMPELRSIHEPGDT